MNLAFAALYWLSSIVLWISIMTGMRTMKVQKDFSLIASLFFSVLFLIMVLKFTLFKPMYYVIGGSIYFIFTMMFIPWQFSLRNLIYRLTNFILWPHSICFAMFLYSAKPNDESDS